MELPRFVMKALIVSSHTRNVRRRYASLIANLPCDNFSQCSGLMYEVVSCPTQRYGENENVYSDAERMCRVCDVIFRLSYRTIYMNKHDN